LREILFFFLPAGEHDCCSPSCDARVSGPPAGLFAGRACKKKQTGVRFRKVSALWFYLLEARPGRRLSAFDADVSTRGVRTGNKKKTPSSSCNVASWFMSAAVPPTGLPPQARRAENTSMSIVKRDARHNRLADLPKAQGLPGGAIATACLRVARFARRWAVPLWFTPDSVRPTICRRNGIRGGVGLCNGKAGYGWPQPGFLPDARHDANNVCTGRPFASGQGRLRGLPAVQPAIYCRSVDDFIARGRRDTGASCWLAASRWSLSMPMAR